MPPPPRQLKPMAAAKRIRYLTPKEDYSSDSYHFQFYDPNLARQLKESSPGLTGGAAAGMATAGQMKSQGAGYDGDTIRPTLKLMLRLRDITGSETVNSGKRIGELENWMSTSLTGVRMGATPEEALEADRELRTEVKDLSKDVEKIMSGEDKLVDEEEAELKNLASDAEKTKGALDELFSAIKSRAPTDLESVIDLSDISDAASDVVSSIPLLGTITAGAKALMTSFSLGALAYEAYKVSKIDANTLSQIEHEVVGAIHHYEKREAADLGKNLGGQLLTAGAATAGAGAAGSVATQLANIVYKVTLRIIAQMEAKRVNKAIINNQLSVAILRSSPTLGLYLPHLPDMDSLTLLGLVPPGWKSLSDTKGRVQNRLSEITSAGGGRVTSGDLGWLYQSLKWNEPGSMYGSPDGSGLGGGALAVTTAVRKKPNPWTKEYDRLRYLLEKSDKYLYRQQLKLFLHGTSLHEASPTSMKEKALEKLKHTFSKLPPVRKT